MEANKTVPYWWILRSCPAMRKELKFYTPTDIAELNDKDTLKRIQLMYTTLCWGSDCEVRYSNIMLLCIWKRLREL